MIKYFTDVVQGSDEWLAARCGLLTASEMKHIITPKKLEYSSSEKERGHLFELVAQRISKYVEPSYFNDDMLRGHEDEIEAKILYSKTYAEVSDVGFITNDKWGFTLGYSPDGLVGDDGSVECKSRKQKLQIETMLTGLPIEHMLQTQTGLLVSERKWVDYVSYSGGLPMITIRVLPDEKVQKAILEAAVLFHGKLSKMLYDYDDLLTSKAARLIPTQRRVEQEITI